MRKKSNFQKFIVAVLALLLVIGGVVALGPLNKSGKITKLKAPEVSNLLPFPYTNMSGNYGGADVVMSEDGTITVSGKVTTPSAGLTNYHDITLYEGEGLELPEVVTLAANTLANGSYIVLYFNNTKDTKKLLTEELEQLTFETQGLKLTKIDLRLKVDSKPDDMTVQIMLNEGEEAYPYVPYVAD